MAASCSAPSLPIPTLREELSTRTQKPCPLERQQPSPIILPHTLSHRKFQAAPSSGSDSWACELGTLRKTPCLVSGSAVAVVESLITFEQEALHFHFVLGPANQAAGPAHLPLLRARAAFPRKSGPASHSLCVSKNGTHSPWMVRMEQWLPAWTASMGNSGTSGQFPTLICPPFPISALHSTLPGFWPSHSTHPSLNAQLLKGLKFLEGMDTSTSISNSPPQSSFCKHSRNLIRVDGLNQLQYFLNSWLYQL